MTTPEQRQSPLTIYRMNPPRRSDDRCAGTVAICTRDEVKAGTATSWMMTDYSFLPPHEYVARYFIQGNILTMQRNACLYEMDGDWLIFIDDDMTFQPDAIRKLVETQRRTGADIVSALCFQRGHPYQPTLYRRKEGAGYTYMEVWDDGDIIDVDATGMAFCLITVEALSKIIRHEIEDPEAYFLPRDERKKYPPPAFFQWGGQWGEDFFFCQKAKEAGCRIVVDTSIEIGHIGEQLITKETFLREIAFRSAEREAEKRATNDEVGLPILSAEEARRKLGLA